MFTLDGQPLSYARAGSRFQVTAVGPAQPEKFHTLLDAAATITGWPTPVTDPAALANHVLRLSWQQTRPAPWRPRARRRHAQMLRQIS